MTQRFFNTYYFFTINNQLGPRTHVVCDVRFLVLKVV